MLPRPRPPRHPPQAPLAVYHHPLPCAPTRPSGHASTIGADRSTSTGNTQATATAQCVKPGRPGSTRRPRMRIANVHIGSDADERHRDLWAPLLPHIALRCIPGLSDYALPLLGYYTAASTLHPAGPSAPKHSAASGARPSDHRMSGAPPAAGRGNMPAGLLQGVRPASATGSTAAATSKAKPSGEPPGHGLARPSGAGGCGGVVNVGRQVTCVGVVFADVGETLGPFLTSQSQQTSRQGVRARQMQAVCAPGFCCAVHVAVHGHWGVCLPCCSLGA